MWSFDVVSLEFTNANIENAPKPLTLNVVSILLVVPLNIAPSTP